MKKILFISLLLTNIGIAAEFSWWTKLKQRVQEKINDYKDWRGTKNYESGKGLSDLSARSHINMIYNAPESQERKFYDNLRRSNTSTNYFNSLAQDKRKQFQDASKAALQNVLQRRDFSPDDDDYRIMYYKEMVRRTHGGVMPENVDKPVMFA